MASAEHLLHEAQYAFQSISFGQSRQNARNASRAKSLCKKIIRKFPGSMEAAEAHAILRRLGEEAYSSKINLQHRHISQSTHHREPSSTLAPQNSSTGNGEVETLNWGGLIAWVLAVPKAVLAMIALGAIFLFGVLGPLLFLPLIALFFLTGPFRKIMKPEQRKDLDAFVVRANAYIADQLA